MSKPQGFRLQWTLHMAEMEGFEPPHALRRLADFESAPFSHLGTSPETLVLYQRPGKKSRFFPVLFYQFQNILHLCADFFIVLPAVGTQTAGAVLDTRFGIPEAAAAVFTQAV